MEKNILAIDVGGTNIKYAVVKSNGKFATTPARITTPKVPNGESEYVKAYNEYLNVLKTIFDNQSRLYNITGIAISHPGTINNGTIESAGGVKYASNRSLADDLSLICNNKDVTIVNDAKAATMAELEFGALKGEQNCACMTFGTAIGMGLVIDGKIKSGDCEPSYISHNDNIEEKTEAVNNYYGIYSSTSAFITGLIAELNLPNGTTGEELFEKYYNDERYHETIDLELRKFVRKAMLPIFNFNLICKIDKVAIGGGISNQPVFVDTINKAMQDLSNRMIFKMMSYKSPIPEIVACEFKSEANLVGAVANFNEEMQRMNIITTEIETSC